jgi:DNA-binding transcriptional regulator YiaG
MKKSQSKFISGSKILGRTPVLKDFLSDLKSTKPKILNHSARVVSLKIDKTPFTGKDVKAVRQALRLSIGLFAEFLGVEVNAITLWENGTKKPQWLANRFMQEIARDPVYWRKRLAQMAYPTNDKYQTRRDEINKKLDGKK